VDSNPRCAGGRRRARVRICPGGRSAHRRMGADSRATVEARVHSGAPRKRTAIGTTPPHRRSRTPWRRLSPPRAPDPCYLSRYPEQAFDLRGGEVRGSTPDNVSEDSLGTPPYAQSRQGYMPAEPAAHFRQNHVVLGVPARCVHVHATHEVRRRADGAVEQREPPTKHHKPLAHPDPPSRRCSTDDGRPRYPRSALNRPPETAQAPHFRLRHFGL